MFGTAIGGLIGLTLDAGQRTNINDIAVVLYQLRNGSLAQEKAASQICRNILQPGLLRYFMQGTKDMATGTVDQYIDTAIMRDAVSHCLAALLGNGDIALRGKNRTTIIGDVLRGRAQAL